MRKCNNVVGSSRSCTVGEQAMEHGFTLIELLMVVVIIAVLAMIAIPQFSSTREKAFNATVREEVGRLIAVQDSFRSENGRFARISDLEEVEWEPSTATQLDSLVVAESSWWAVVSHQDAEIRCGYASTKSAGQPLFLDSIGAIVCQGQ